MHDRTFTPTRSRVWTAARFAAHSMPPRVLVVDDYIDSADALAAFLANSGFDTRVAYNGCDALKIANEWRPDSVVLDIAMPGVSGLAVALRAGGFDGVCAKPIDPLMVVDILTTLLAMPALKRGYDYHS